MFQGFGWLPLGFSGDFVGAQPCVSLRLDGLGHVRVYFS